MQDMTLEHTICFSVVIPCYNRAHTISRALDSVLNQTFHDFEIIVVDDGSKDNTEAVIKKYQDPRIIYIKQNNGGANSARNNGIMHARGKYVAFLDSDDTFEPNMLEEQKKAYESNPDVGFIYTNLDLVVNGQHLPFGLDFGIQGQCYKEALEQGYIAPTSVISARRECFEQAGVFDLTLPASQDDDMCFKMAKNFKIHYIDKILAHMYGDAGNQISNVKNPAKGWWMLWNKYEKDVLDLCGKEVMARHYRECLVWFVRADMYNMTCKAYSRSCKYGGHFSVKTRILLTLFKITRAKSARIKKRLQASI